jgi:hypothetical protein
MMAKLPPYYDGSGSYYTSTTSLAPSSPKSVSATSFLTSSSATLVAAPREAIGNGLCAFGKMALSGYRGIVVRRRLQAISSKMPHPDNAIIQGLEEMYGDLLELSRSVLCSINKLVFRSLADGTL